MPSAGSAFGRLPVVLAWEAAAIVSGLLVMTGCGGCGPASHPRSNVPYNAPVVAFSGDSKDLQQTVVVPTLDAAIPQGKNAIWCASFQMAWDRLKSDVIAEPIRIAGAEDIADRLNKAAISENDLPEGSFYATAGRTSDGIAETIRRDMQERFGKEPAELEDKDAVILAYAYLQANLPFTLPYFENHEAFDFTDGQGKQTPVSSFGLRDADRSKYYDVRGQVEVLYLHREKDPYQPSEFALDLCRASQPNQIILACLPRKETLQATLKDLEQKIGDSRPEERERKLGSNALLLVPNLHWSVSHRFSELEGADKSFQNEKARGLWIATAQQTIDFRLDRSGVEFKSQVRTIVPCSDPDYFFNRPFLIVMKKRGAERPFFAMWVENAELLCKYYTR